jgi:lysophospholipase L1-like esterase
MLKFAGRVLILTLAMPAVAMPLVAQNSAGPYPAAPEYRPAVALGEVPATARTVDTPRGYRVWAETALLAPGEELGPPTSGDDGAPAMVALPDGEFLVMAARWRAQGAELWAQRGSANGWRKAERLRLPGASNHHPALAADKRGVWAAWLAETTAGGRAVMAAEWTGRRLARPEPVPAAGTGPGVPAIALDATGRPVAVWSAFDGTDTEIWLSRRSDSGWSTPVPLSNNDVPDELPDIGRGANERLVVSWSSFTPEGYQPYAIRELGGDRFGSAARLDRRPVGMTEVLGGAADTVTWSGVRASGRILRMTSRGRRGWRPATDVGAVGPSRIRVDSRDGRVLAATTDGTATLGLLRRAEDGATQLDLGLAPARGEPRSANPLPALPGTYRAFGDSITEGVVRFDGIPVVTPGYPAPLGVFLASFLDRPSVFVENSGRGGEITIEGVGRLASLNSSSPRLYTFIMEGINDASQSINPDTVLANLRSMVRTSMTSGRVAIISTVTPRTQGGFTGGANPQILLYNDLIVPMARGEGALLVDQWSAFLKRAHLYSDLLHPNEAGYEYMAATWFRGIQPLLTALLQSEDDEVAAARRFVDERRSEATTIR